MGAYDHDKHRVLSGVFNAEEAEAIDALAAVRKTTRSKLIGSCVREELDRVQKSGGTVEADREAIRASIADRAAEYVAASGRVSKVSPRTVDKALDEAASEVAELVEAVAAARQRVAQLESDQAIRAGGGPLR